MYLYIGDIFYHFGDLNHNLNLFYIIIEDPQDLDHIYVYEYWVLQGLIMDVKQGLCLHVHVWLSLKREKNKIK